jgi:hypothetical protein
MKPVLDLYLRTIYKRILVKDFNTIIPIDVITVYRTPYCKISIHDNITYYNGKGVQYEVYFI